MEQKILITGANGFIGGYLVDEALKQNLKVYAGLRAGSPASSLQDKPVQILTLDYNDVLSLSQLLTEHNFDYIIHNAGITKSPEKKLFYEVNVTLLVNIVEAIKHSSIELKKFIFISSLAAYGPADQVPDQIITESCTPRPVTEYGRSKLAAEAYLKQQSEIPFVIIRPTAVYGPKDKEFLNVYHMITKGVNLQPGLKTQHLSFIYTKDLAALIILAAKSSYKNTAYFVSDGKLYTSDYYVSIVKKLLGKRTIDIKVPIPVVKIITFFMENISRLMGDYSILNTDKVNELQARYWNCDSTKILSELNYNIQYDLPTGVAETTQWYKDNKWI